MDCLRVIAVLISSALFGCGSTHGSKVSEQDLGARWPLTVSAGNVDCESGALIFRYKGISYALNIDRLKKASGNRTNLEERGWLSEESSHSKWT
jgi:hypothetical protein